MNKSTQKPAVLEVNPSDCILCYACVRECPAQAIEVKSNEDSVRIVQDRCTACGSCYTVCPTEAIHYLSDLPDVELALSENSKVVALIDPSISAEFPDITDYRRFIGMIKSIGFHYVLDVSFGAELVAQEHARIFSSFKGKYFISSKCPAVVYQVTKYFSNLTENLAPIKSPAGVTAEIARANYGTEAYIVSVSPCLASKLEQEDPDSGLCIDAHITFTELRKLFTHSAITEKQVEFADFDNPSGRKGSLFPLTSGLMQTAGQMENLISSNYHSSSGRNNMLDALDEFNKSNEIRKHLDLFYCEGCLMGPGMSPGGRKFMRQTLVKDYAKKRIEELTEAEWQVNVDQYQEVDFGRSYTQDNQSFEPVSEEKITEILRSIGKSESDRVDRGCASCGYKSCHDFAVAVANGMAKADMCHSFGTRNRQEYIRSLQETNEQLAKTKQALEDSEKHAQEEKQMVLSFSDTITAVMQKIPSGVVITDSELKVVQANTVLVNMLGDEAQSIHEVIPGLKGADIKSLLPQNIHQLFSFVVQNQQELINKDIKLGERILNLSIFPINQGQTYGAIFRDMSSPEVQKEEVIKRVTETIDKNLEMVQQIGFLLGEGAAETERMLNSIIRSYKQKDDQ